MISLLNKIVWLLINKAYASSLPNPIPGCESLSCIVGKIVPHLRNIALVVFTIMIFVGGYILMTAGGNEEQIKKGKSALLWAVLGYLAILIAEGLRFIIEDIFK